MDIFKIFDFRVQGELTVKNNNIERNDCKSIEEKVINSFRKDSKDINKKIIQSLKKTINQLVFEELNIDIDVELRYKNGSIMFFGIVSITIEWSAKLGDTNSFISFLKKIIKKQINNVLKSQIEKLDLKRSDYYTSIFIIPIYKESNLTKNIIKEQKKDDTEILFSLKIILITITLVNLIIFFGGTISNNISIKSIDEKTRETSKIISETRKEFQNSIKEMMNSVLKSKAKIDNIIISTKENLSKKSDQLDNLYKQEKSELDSIMVSIRKSLAKESEQLNKLHKRAKSELDTLIIHIDSLNTSLTERKKIIKILNQRIDYLNKQEPKINIWHLWRLSDRLLKIIYIIIIINILINFYLLLKSKR